MKFIVDIPLEDIVDEAVELSAADIEPLIKDLDIRAASWPMTERLARYFVEAMAELHDEAPEEAADFRTFLRDVFFEGAIDLKLQLTNGYYR